jgi:NAD(P)-dependent dehydrogenase (short-subunit alcohol dehydrogenase family)
MSRHKRILITGATSGFGAGAALGLARAGHEVTACGETWRQVLTLRERAEAEKVRKFEVIKLDLLNDLDIAHAADREIDILVLNAAVQEAGSLADIPLELVRRSFEINVFRHLDLAQRVIPQLIERKGKIVWVSSQAGLIPLPWIGTYAATKHAIEGIASTMRIELAPFHVGVATINPGFYRTGFNETGAESYQQWAHDGRDVRVPMPPAGPALAFEADPQPMIDAMVDAIPDSKSGYRTMLPESAVEQTKLAQKLGWETKAS